VISLWEELGVYDDHVRGVDCHSCWDFDKVVDVSTSEPVNSQERNL
jgi:hypothetical protein